MSTSAPPADNRHMDYEDLFRLAVAMAYTAFKAPCDAQVLGVFERLVRNEAYCLPDCTAVTVH